MKKRTKLIVRILLLSGTTISLFFVPWIVVWAWILPLPETVQEQVDGAIDHGFDGIIVYVDQAGHEPAFYSAGWKNREKKIPADPHSLFKIASISKLYVATATTKLVSEGRLSLDKSLAEYFPELSNRIEHSEKITLRHMVQHRSGIPDFTDTPDYWAHPVEWNQEALDLILDKPANFLPDTDYEYCNTNYLLIALLLDKTLGYSHHKYIQEKILKPLDLKNTYSSVTNVDINNVMSGYHVGHPYDLKTDDQGMVATAQDVGKFMRALNEGSLFNEKEQEIYSSIYVFEHSGWVPGYQSHTKYYKDIDAVVVQFNNTTDPDLYLWNLSEVIFNRIEKIIRKNNTPS